MVRAGKTPCGMETLTEEQARKLAVFAVTILENPYIPHEPTSQQARFLMCDGLEAFYGGAAGGGKALDVELPIPTPDGWKRMGDIHPGDFVFGMDGTPVRVRAESEVRNDRPCYRVVFDDGSEMVADGSHGWLTFDASEMNALTRRDDGWRARRRERRVSRASGNKSLLFTTMLMELNKNNPPPTKEAPQGTVRRTREISETVTVRGRRNHAVPVHDGLRLPDADLPIEPYLLGVWLGGGTSASGAFTTADEEIAESFRSFGYEVNKRSGRYDYGTVGFSPKLREAGLLKNKHIPQGYLRASECQRLELLRGLMDTDGHACESGAVEFTTTNPRLADGVLELIHSLGMKAVVSEGRATVNGKDCGAKYRIKWSANVPVFKLARKLARQKVNGHRRTTRFRYVVSCEPVESIPVKCINVAAMDGMFLAGRSMVPTHNSDALLMAALQYVHVKGYAALLLRKSYPDLALPGALMDRGRDWLHGSEAKWDDKNKTWHFPAGSSLTFGYLATETDKYRYKSAEFQFIGFDELTQFDEASYLYLFSRLRKPADMKVPLRMRAASNPGDIGHAWVKARFLTPEGTEAGRIFVPAKVDDNPHIDREEYLNSLWQLTSGDEVTYRQLREGDWDAFAGQVFSEWTPSVHVVKPFEIPKGWMRFRSMDWGFATPYCVNWWAVDFDGKMYCYRELYGWGGKPNIGTRETASEVAGRVLGLSKDDGEFEYNTADPSIWGERGGTGPSIGEEFMQAGIPWMMADNNRMSGKHQFHKRLRGWDKDNPGIAFFDTCVHSIRTIPVLPADRNRPEDVDTRAEDHAYDSVRYACMSRPWASEMDVPGRPRDAWDDEPPDMGNNFMAM